MRVAGGITSFSCSLVTANETMKRVIPRSCAKGLDPNITREKSLLMGYIPDNRVVSSSFSLLRR
jgi:hypothetical protein